MLSESKQNKALHFVGGPKDNSQLNWGSLCFRMWVILVEFLLCSKTGSKRSELLLLAKCPSGNTLLSPYTFLNFLAVDWAHNKSMDGLHDDMNSTLTTKLSATIMTIKKCNITVVINRTKPSIEIPVLLCIPYKMSVIANVPAASMLEHAFALWLRIMHGCP